MVKGMANEQRAVPFVVAPLVFFLSVLYYTSLAVYSSRSARRRRQLLLTQNAKHKRRLPVHPDAPSLVA